MVFTWGKKVEITDAAELEAYIDAGWVPTGTWMMDEETTASATLLRSMELGWPPDNGEPVFPVKPRKKGGWLPIECNPRRKKLRRCGCGEHWLKALGWKQLTTAENQTDDFIGKLNSAANSQPD